MKFITIRDLRGNSRKLVGLLNKSGKLVLTSNGKPIALLTAVNEDNMEDELLALRQARAIIALEKIRDDAEKRGTSSLSMGKIDRIIRDTRKEKKKASAA